MLPIFMVPRWDSSLLSRMDSHLDEKCTIRVDYISYQRHLAGWDAQMVLKVGQRQSLRPNNNKHVEVPKNAPPKNSEVLGFFGRLHWKSLKKNLLRSKRTPKKWGNEETATFDKHMMYITLSTFWWIPHNSDGLAEQPKKQHGAVRWFFWEFHWIFAGQ